MYEKVEILEPIYRFSAWSASGLTCAETIIKERSIKAGKFTCFYTFNKITTLSQPKGVSQNAIVPNAHSPPN